MCKGSGASADMRVPHPAKVGMRAPECRIGGDNECEEKVGLVRHRQHHGDSRNLHLGIGEVAMVMKLYDELTKKQQAKVDRLCFQINRLEALGSSKTSAQWRRLSELKAQLKALRGY